MNDVAASLRVALADQFAFYFKAHAYHWNVEGPLFRQLHEFLGDLYEDAFEAVDGIAEEIRALGELAPMSLSEIAAPATITFPGAGDAESMISQLSQDNDLLVASLEAAYDVADAAGQDGLSNYLQDRLNKQKKWGWMLAASLDKQPAPAARMRRYPHAGSPV